MIAPAAYAAVQKGSILFQQGRYQEAAQTFQQALSSDPQDAYLLHLLANCQYLMNGQLKNALQTIDRSLSIEPQEAHHYQLKALILAEMDKSNDALEQINRAISLNPDYDEAYAVQAYIFIKMERWAEAETSAREALRLNAENIFAGNMLISALNMQNKLKGSHDIVSHLLSKDPEGFSSHSSAGWTYLMQGDYKKAQTHFKESLRLNPNFEPARIGMLEAFKSQSKFYRVYLKYSFWMSQIGRRNRWLVILGIYFLARFLSNSVKTLSGGPYAILIYLVLGAIYTFFFWTWIAGSLGNLIAFSDSGARHALKPGEKWDAIGVGGLFIGGLLLVAVAAVFKITGILFLGLAMVLASIPFSITFQNRNRIGRLLYGSIGCWILAVGIFCMIYQLMGIAAMESAVGVAAAIALLLFVATTWLGALGAWRH